MILRLMVDGVPVHRWWMVCGEITTRFVVLRVEADGGSLLHNTFTGMTGS